MALRTTARTPSVDPQGFPFVPACGPGPGLQPPLVMAESSDAAEKAKRVRSLLSSYYTANNEAPTQSRAAASIDSAAFDTDAYIANLVRPRATDRPTDAGSCA